MKHRKPDHSKRVAILNQGVCSFHIIARCAHGIELADDEDGCVLCRLDEATKFTMLPVNRS